MPQEASASMGWWQGILQKHGRQAGGEIRTREDDVGQRRQLAPCAGPARRRQGMTASWWAVRVLLLYWSEQQRPQGLCRVRGEASNCCVNKQGQMVTQNLKVREGSSPSAEAAVRDLPGDG